MIEVAMLLHALSGTPAAPLEVRGAHLMEMQQQSRSAAVMRIRMACWQSLGFPPGMARSAYPGRLLPQVEACVARRSRR